MKRILFLIIPVLLLSISCQHETDVFDGPSLIDRFGEFRIKENLAASKTSVDFSAGENVHFTASFSKNIAWLLRITGKTSGSVKEIEGFSNELNATNSVWNGTTSQLPLFGVEDVMVDLIIPEEDSLTETIEIGVGGTRTYEGSLITGFETDPGASLEFGNFQFEFSPETGIRDNSFLPAGEGEKFYFFEGTDANVANDFFVGLIRIFPSINGEQFFSLPTTIPENLYFNSFLYGDLTPNTIAVLQFFTDSNGDGTFTDGADQSFQFPGDYPISHDGWKHIHHSMAEVNERSDGTGNSISEAQLQELVAIQVLLISNANGQPNPPLPVRFGLDFLTFTKDQPLEL